MALVSECPHNEHGSSFLFITDGLKVNNISACEKENVESLQWGYLVLLYTPCTDHHLNNSNSLHWDKETSLIGYFNSHSTHWGYTTTSSYGESVKQWADSNTTHIQRETNEIIQQCNMEEGVQPGSHLCIVNHFGYV